MGGQGRGPRFEAPEVWRLPPCDETTSCFGVAECLLGDCSSEPGDFNQQLRSQLEALLALSAAVALAGRRTS